MQDTGVKKLARLQEYYLLTNIKGILTLLIVCYHLVSLRLNSGVFGSTELPMGILPVTPLFMAGFALVPMFIMITGYYSKNTESCRTNAFSTALIPYIILQVISMVFFGLIVNQKVAFNLFMPCFQLWYLLSLYFWHMTLKDVVRIKGGFWIMLAASLLVGVTLSFPFFTFDEGVGVYMSLFHTVAFYPFLLIGYYTTPERLAKIKNIKLIYVILLIVVFVIISLAFEYWMIASENISGYSQLLLKSDNDYIQYLFSDANGQVTGLNSRILVSVVGVIYRLVNYICVIIVAVLAVRFIPMKKIPFITKVGNGSLTVYCLHAFIAIPLGMILPMGNIWVYMLLVAICAVAISWLLSLNAINKSYTKFIFFTGDKLMKKKDK